MSEQKKSEMPVAAATTCSPSSLTPETDAVWEKHSGTNAELAIDAIALCGKMERERDAARAAAKYAECYMRHHHGCRTQAPLSEATAKRCDCGLIETWREVRKGILSENVKSAATGSERIENE